MLSLKLILVEKVHNLTGLNVVFDVCEMLLMNVSLHSVKDQSKTEGCSLLSLFSSSSSEPVEEVGLLYRCLSSNH